MAARFVVALVGNPNSGKTSLFNALTGSHYKVANYPGVTVERREGIVKSETDTEIVLVDLPGIYSLGWRSDDERVAAEALLGLKGNNRPDALLVVLDASNLERNLFLFTQIAELQIPSVIALTMRDIAEAHGVSVKSERLSSELGAAVYPVHGARRTGVEDLRNALLRLSNSAITPPRTLTLSLPQEYLECARSLGATAQDALQASHVSLQGLLGASRLSGQLSIDTPAAQSELVAARQGLSAKGIDGASIEISARYQAIHELVQRCQVIRPHSFLLSERIDTILTHRLWGSVVFLAVMLAIFQVIFSAAQLPMDAIDSAVTTAGLLLNNWLPDGLFKSLLVDGVLAGVGSTLVFVPQIAMLFFMLGLLEDSGYLARAATIMDRPMRLVGLQGRSFIPLLSSFACAIPGIMSTRTISSFTDRLITMLVAPLMSCSARLPVYALMIAAFIPATPVVGPLSLQGVTLFSLYLLGVMGAALGAIVLRLFVFRGAPTLFVMEMPPLRRPSFRVVGRQVYDRVLIFLTGAGTVILACSVVMWALASFPTGDIHTSIAGSLGRLLQPLIAPLGWGWEIGVAIVASFAAREVFVSTLATMYNLQSGDGAAQSLTDILHHQYQQGNFSLASAISLLVFYVFACQCMSTLAVLRRETNSWRWPIALFVVLSIVAYAAAFIAYRIFAK